MIDNLKETLNEPETESQAESESLPRKRKKTRSKSAASSASNQTKKASQARYENRAMRGELIEQVPPGIYLLAFIKHEIKRLHGGSLSVVLWFRVVTPGAECGKVVARYYRVAGTGKGGKFKSGPKALFTRHYVNLFGPPKRYDRFNMQKFNNVVIEGTIRTVKKSKDQRPLAPGSQYSTVDELLKVAAGL